MGGSACRTSKRSAGSWSRRGVAAMLSVGFVLATAAVPSASAETAFNAEVKSHIQRPVGCPDGANLCGQATIDGFGTAEYRFFVTSFQPTSDACGDYTAITTFTLGDG